jgi:hypothetical protein
VTERFSAEPVPYLSQEPPRRRRAGRDALILDNGHRQWRWLWPRVEPGVGRREQVRIRWPQARPPWPGGWGALQLYVAVRFYGTPRAPPWPKHAAAPRLSTAARRRVAVHGTTRTAAGRVIWHTNFLT